MKVFFGIEYFLKFCKDRQNDIFYNYLVKNGSVLTIGKFDVIHNGHKNLLNKIIDIAKTDFCVPIVVLLHPNPQKLFHYSDINSKYLYSLKNRCRIINQIFTDTMNNNSNNQPIVIIQKFNKSFSLISKDNFVKQYLKNTLFVKNFVSGINFNFGYKALGNIDDIKKADINCISIDLGELLNVGCDEELLKSSANLSSTFIKNLMLNGKIKQANNLCYRNIFYEGCVKKGMSVAGSKLNFKTANIKLNQSKYIIPKFGVYKCNILINEKIFSGICNIGNRPTVNDIQNNILLEAHIFNFNEDIYNQRICIELLDFVREERKFNNIEELKKQIKLDIDFLINN